MTTRQAAPPATAGGAGACETPHPGAPNPTRRARRIIRKLTPAGFLAPFFLPFVLVYLTPIVYAIAQSFQKIERVGGLFGSEVTAFAGLSNYGTVVTSEEFQSGLLRVCLFGLVQVPVMMGTALFLALLLDAPTALGGRLFRLIYFMPIAVPGVISALMWGSLLDPATSPFYDLGLEVNFLSASWVLVSIGNVGVWGFAGVNTVIILSALTSVPKEVYEAARIDGASDIKTALFIKIPLVRPAILFAGLLSVIGSLQMFTEPVLFRTLTSHITSGFTPNMLAYTLATSNQYNLAAALSVTLAVVTFVLSLVLLRPLMRGLPR